MDWTENQQCVLCDKGGNLLVCNGDGCPISIHKSCMGCEACLDDMGNFYCPYCVYKQLTAETRQLKAKVMLTKKALSTFLEEEKRDDKAEETRDDKEEEMRDDKAEETRDDKADEKRDDKEEEMIDDKEEETRDGGEEEISSQNKLVDEVNPVANDDVQNHCEETSDTLVPEQSNVNTCRTMVVYKEDGIETDELELNVSKRIKVVDQRGNDMCKSVVVDPQHCRKHRVLWSEEEEDMLKEGVQKFSTSTRKNLPWKKILDFGRHIYDSCRTPSDLKDKWRKISK